jgi:hypothetical protein
MQPAFGGKRLNDAALGDIGEQPDRAVQAGFAAAVRPGHDIQCAEPEPDISKRSVAGNGDLRDHKGGRVRTSAQSSPPAIRS